MFWNRKVLQYGSIKKKGSAGCSFKMNIQRKGIEIWNCSNSLEKVKVIKGYVETTSIRTSRRDLNHVATKTINVELKGWIAVQLKVSKVGIKVDLVVTVH